MQHSPDCHAEMSLVLMWAGGLYSLSYWICAKNIKITWWKYYFFNQELLAIQILKNLCCKCYDCIQAGIQWKWKCELLRYTTWGLEENEKVDEGTNRVLSKEKIDTEILLSSIKSIQ